MNAPDRFDSLEPLLHGLVHEIRNPVQGILASAEALRCLYDEDGKGNKLLEMIQRESLRIEQLLSDLLDLAHPVTVDRTKAQSLKPLLEECIRSFQQQPNSTARINSNIPEHLPLLFMDSHSMRKAIIALLQNAMESGKDAGLTIGITAEKLNDQIRIRIEDNGEGIFPEDFDHVLEPFFSTRPKKAGLGLTIAERNVRLQDGHFQIESKREAGTVVLIDLPVAR